MYDAYVLEPEVSRYMTFARRQILFGWSWTMSSAKHVARMGERQGKTEENRQIWRPRFQWEDNIKMDLQEIEWGSANWIALAQIGIKWMVVVDEEMKLWVHKNAGIFLTS